MANHTLFNMSRYHQGWVAALVCTLIFQALASVFVRYSSYILDVHYIVFTCLSFISSATVLIIAGGPGNLIKETVHSISTWLFGIILFLNVILLLSLFSYVSAAEGTILQRITLIIGILFTWFFMGRTPIRGQLVGSGLVMLGVGLVFYDLPDRIAGISMIVILLLCLVQVCRVFSAELHAPHREAIVTTKDPRVRSRVVGFVMFVVSVFFLFMMGVLAGIQETVPVFERIPIIPTITDFTHVPTIISGLLFGVVIIAPIRFLEFYSSSIIKTDNYFAAYAFMPISTYLFESALGPSLGLTGSFFSNLDLLALGLVSAGGLVAAVTKIMAARNDKQIKWQDYLAYQGNNPLIVEDTHDIVRRALQHTNKNIVSAAKLLNLPLEVLDTLIRDRDETLAFTPDIFVKVIRQYRQKIGTTDNLTGLNNRHEFNARVQELKFKTRERHALLVIDIDHFKTINDTYGHDAGDKVLKAIAQHLKKIAKDNDICGRWGGEEFVCVLTDSTDKQAQTTAEDLRKAIAKKKFTGIKEKVTISIGVTTFGAKDTFDKTFIRADKALYDAKAEGRNKTKAG